MNIYSKCFGISIRLVSLKASLRQRYGTWVYKPCREVMQKEGRPVHHTLISRSLLQVTGAQGHWSHRINPPRGREVRVFILQYPFVIAGWLFLTLIPPTHLVYPKHTPAKRKLLGKDSGGPVAGSLGTCKNSECQPDASICLWSRLFLHWVSIAVLSNLEGYQVGKFHNGICSPG